jgi:hypothetical protein
MGRGVGPLERRARAAATPPEARPRADPRRRPRRARPSRHRPARRRLRRDVRDSLARGRRLAREGPR